MSFTSLISRFDVTTPRMCQACYLGVSFMHTEQQSVAGLVNNTLTSWITTSQQKLHAIQVQLEEKGLELGTCNSVLELLVDLRQTLRGYHTRLDQPVTEVVHVANDFLFFTIRQYVAAMSNVFSVNRFRRFLKGTVTPTQLARQSELLTDDFFETGPEYMITELFELQALLVQLETLDELEQGVQTALLEWAKLCNPLVAHRDWKDLQTEIKNAR